AEWSGKVQREPEFEPGSLRVGQRVNFRVPGVFEEFSVKSLRGGFAFRKDDVSLAADGGRSQGEGSPGDDRGVGERRGLPFPSYAQKALESRGRAGPRKTELLRSVLEND